MAEFKNLDALADQLYSEGMEKAQKESKKLLSDTEKQAEKLIADAKKQADEMLSQAKAEAEKHASAVESEIHQKARQAKQDLKVQIESLINAKILDSATNELLSDQEFVKQLILAVTEAWQGGEEVELTIPEKMSQLQNDLKAKVHHHLDGMEIHSDQQLKTGFKIESKDKGYMLSFTEADFKALFEPYLSKAVSAILFESVE
jgi:V/A-type H+-transporting ATPase subunit E